MKGIQIMLIDELHSVYLLYYEHQLQLHSKHLLINAL